MEEKELLVEEPALEQEEQQAEVQAEEPKKVKTGKGISAVSLVLGILAIVIAWGKITSWFAWALGVAGIVFSAIGMKKAKAAGARRGLAVAGLVLSIIGTALALIGLMCVCTGKILDL